VAGGGGVAAAEMIRQPPEQMTNDKLVKPVADLSFVICHSDGGIAAVAGSAVNRTSFA